MHNCLPSPSKAPPQKDRSRAVSKWAVMHYNEISFEEKKFKKSSYAKQHSTPPMSLILFIFLNVYCQNQQQPAYI